MLNGSEERIEPDRPVHVHEVKSILQRRLGHGTHLQMVFKEGEETELQDEELVEDGERVVEPSAEILLFMVLRSSAVNAAAEEIAFKYTQREMEQGGTPDCVLKLLLIGNSGTGKRSLFIRMGEDSFPHNPEQMQNNVVDFRVKTLVRDSTAEVESESVAGEGDKSDLISRASTLVAASMLDASMQIKVQLWYVPTQDRSIGHNGMSHSFYRNQSSIIMVFDLTNRQSFEDLKGRWKRELEQHGDLGVPVVLVGTKADLVGSWAFDCDQVAAVDAGGGQEPCDGAGGTGEGVEAPIVDRAVSVQEAEVQAAEWGALYVETSAKTGAGGKVALCAAVEAALQHALRKQRLVRPARRLGRMSKGLCRSPVCQCTAM
jgi:small GTP-binding protein